MRDEAAVLLIFRYAGWLAARPVCDRHTRLRRHGRWLFARAASAGPARCEGDAACARVQPAGVRGSRIAGGVDRLAPARATSRGGGLDGTNRRAADAVVRTGLCRAGAAATRSRRPGRCGQQSPCRSLDALVDRLRRRRCVAGTGAASPIRRGHPSRQPRCSPPRWCPCSRCSCRNCCRPDSPSASPSRSGSRGQSARASVTRSAASASGSSPTASR